MTLLEFAHEYPALAFGAIYVTMKIIEWITD